MRSLVAWSFLVATSANAQPPASSTPLDYRDRIAFDTGVSLDRELASLTQLRNTSRWSEAATLLRVLIDANPGVVVDAGAHRFLGIRAWCHCELASWPDAGRTAYQRLVDPVAQPRFQDALVRRDIEAMRSVVGKYFGSSVHDDALWQLAHWAWEDGQLDVAEGYWRQMLPREFIVSETLPELRLALITDSDYAPEHVMARMTMCRLFSQGPDESRRSVDTFESMFPAATGELAGESGLYADILHQVLDDAKQWDRRISPYESSNSRGGRRSFQVLGFAWSRGRSIDDSHRLRQTSLEGHQMESLPASVIVNGDALILIEPDSIQVLNTRSGESYWPSGNSDDEGVIHVSRGTEESRRPILSGVGVPQASGIVNNGDAFATLGWPILVEAESELRVLNSQVASFDLAEGEGLSNWIAEDRDVLPENWRFSGRPVVTGVQVVIPTTTRSGPIALGLASLNNSSGELNWHRELCGVNDTRSLRIHKFGQYLISNENGHIIWHTAAASVLRIDATDGDVAWAVTYPSDAIVGERLTRGNDVSEISEPFVSDGVVYTIGAAGRRVLAIDEVHGVVRWTTTFPLDVRHILGEHDGVMVVGGDLLWGLDAVTGEVVWKCGFGSPEGAGVGKGIVAGGTAWWTTRDALFSTDIMSGNLIARVGIREAWGITGGDLYLAEDHLLILSPNRLSALAIQSSP